CRRRLWVSWSLMRGSSLNTCCGCLLLWWVGGGAANTLLGPGRTGPCGFLLVPRYASYPLVGGCACVGCGLGVCGVCASVAGPAFLCLPVGGCGGGGVWLWIMVFS